MALSREIHYEWQVKPQVRQTRPHMTESGKKKIPDAMHVIFGGCNAGEKSISSQAPTRRIREALGMDPITARDTSQAVAHMFNLMDAWRHVPNYRLEGRLAPFFELFLLDVLGESLPGVEFHPVVIPEFPLRKGTLDGEEAHAKPNESYNVDYVAFFYGPKNGDSRRTEDRHEFS